MLSGNNKIQVKIIVRGPILKSTENMIILRRFPSLFPRISKNYNLPLNYFLQHLINYGLGASGLHQFCPTGPFAPPMPSLYSLLLKYVYCSLTHST